MCHLRALLLRSGLYRGLAVSVAEGGGGEDIVSGDVLEGGEDIVAFVVVDTRVVLDV